MDLSRRKILGVYLLAFNANKIYVLNAKKKKKKLKLTSIGLLQKNKANGI